MKRSFLFPLALFLVVLTAWEAFCRLGGIPDFILPPPTRILRVALGDAAILLPHAGITLVEILAGIALALTIFSSRSQRAAFG